MRPRSRRGVTITELMVAMVILTVGVLAGVGTFQYITKAISQGRLKTIATNLAQEKMEVLKNKSYSLVLVTTCSLSSSGYDPDFVYDNGSYPLETITLWGLPPLHRVVNIDYASVSGTSVSTIPYTSNDTGMKKITVIVYWTERGVNRQVRVDSYYENPSVATLSTGFSGTVSISGGGPLNGALVQVVGSPKWRSYTDSSGRYNFQVSPGSWTLTASSSGFASAVSATLGVSPSIYQDWSPSLTRVSSGTIAADSVYRANPSLVISQVVASTVQADSGFDAQYIELFNPTTAPINIVGAGCVPAPTCADANPLIRLNIDSPFGCTKYRTCMNVQLVYRSTFVAPGGYYLIGNISTFTALGVQYLADAVYADGASWPQECPGAGSSIPSAASADWNPPMVKRIINFEEPSTGHAGSVWLTDSSGYVYDAVGWKHNTNVGSHCEGTCIQHNGGSSAQGLLRGDQEVRFSAACAAGTTYGRAYDSGSNDDDFYFNNTAGPIGLVYRPFSTADSTQTVISGIPSTGTFVFADDGYSAGVLSSDSPLTGAQGQACHNSTFSLVGVGTGTWTVGAVWNGSSATVAGVQTTAGVVTNIANSLTTPAWPETGRYYLSLPYAYTGGLVQGRVFGAGPDYSVRLGPGQGGIRVGSSYGTTTWTDSQGWYALALPTGTVTITANSGNTNANYIASDYDVTVTQGGVTTVPDFHLAKGATIKGYVTAGTGGLANIPVNASCGAVYEDTSDSTGYFYIFVATSAAPYSLAPVLDTAQSYTAAAVSPCSGTGPISCAVAAPGSTIFIGTFTIVGAMGAIQGSVSYDGKPITTGVLIMASIGAISDPPARIVASSAPAQTPIYAVTSQVDGVYRLEVRSSTMTGYNMRAFFPMVNTDTGGISYPGGSKTLSGGTVAPGATVTGKNFSWP
ncbi:MAG: carboxypeptidase regulatory-like domain-containing protein [Elusimicrobia bacterium]|nr:carboxypeptidase regulatory-like domain-containing protein [Elusimicrobiota bacterium]